MNPTSDQNLEHKSPSPTSVPVDPALLHADPQTLQKPPSRSQSPAKRLKSEEPPSETLPPPEPMEDVQYRDGPPAVDDSSTTPSTTNSSAQMVSTDVSSVASPSPPPPVEEQVELVVNGVNTTPKEGEDWFVVSKGWLNRFLAQSPEQRKLVELSKEEAEKEVGSIDNRPIVDKDQLQELQRKKESNRAQGIEDPIPDDFVPIIPSQLGEDFEILPADTWSRLVSWYGLADGSPAIKRKAVNTGDAENPSYQVDLHPPMFTVYKLRNPAAPVSQELIQNEKTQSPQKVVAGKGEGFQKFLSKVKALADVDSKRKIRLWKVRSGSSTESTLDGSANKGAKAAGKEKGTGRFKQMVIDLKDFLDLNIGEERELIDISDLSHDQKYNGSMQITTAGLSDGGAIVVEEQSSDGEWVSEALTKQKKKFGEIITVSKSGGTKKSLATSRSSSPSKFSKSTIITRGREKIEGRPKGTCGLSNLGNTCYMNSALQCLRSVEELSKYFLWDNYERELNPENPLSHNGKVAKAYAGLLKQIFSTSRPSSFAPRDFKYTIGRFGPSFSGYQQQDSQEFLAFLLDGLHEDLNRIKNKPYIEKPDSTDEMVGDNDAIAKLADTHWEIFKKRNDSAVADLFGGLYKSTLVCPVCDKVSITFDPFMDLTLPLPIENNWSKEVYFMPRNAEGGNKIKKIPVELEKHASIRTLKEHLGKKFGVDPNKLMGSEVYKGKFYKHYTDSQAVSEAIHQNDDPYFYVLDDVPTNYPPRKKAKKSRSMITFSTSDDDEEISPDSPDSERLLVPVFHKRSKDGRYRYASEDSFAFPFFIVLDREEQYSYEAILEKVVEKYTFFTNRDLYDGLEREEDDDASSSLENVQPVQPPSEKTEDEEKDGFVDVTMKDAASMAGSDEAEKKTARKPARRKVPSYVSSDLFSLKVSKRKESEGVVTGWTSLETGVDLTSRMGDSALQPAKPKKSALFGALSAGLSGRASPASNVSDDEVEHFEDAPEPQEDTMQDSSDGENNTAYSHDFAASFQQAPISTSTFYGNSSNNSSTGRFRTPPRSKSPSPDHGPLVRWGEAIIAEWTEEGYDSIFGGKHVDDIRGMPTWDDTELVEDSELNEKRKRRELRKKQGIDLEDCLDEFAKAETLSQDDLWYCPRCKELRQASKKFELWKCPDVLVIHLKRFSSSRSFRDKIEVQVQCPIEGLDLSKRVGITEDKGQTYDLFAVDNHYGGLGGGHYTAYIKNWVDRKWYYCDDASVRETSAEKVVTPAAYLLFYRRRSDKPLGGPGFAQILSKSSDGNSESEDEGHSSGPEPSSSRESSPQPRPLLSTSPTTVGNENLWGTPVTEELPSYSESGFGDSTALIVPDRLGYEFGQNAGITDEDEGIAADVEDTDGTVIIGGDDPNEENDKVDEVRLEDAADDGL